VASNLGRVVGTVGPSGAGSTTARRRCKLVAMGEPIVFWARPVKMTDVLASDAGDAAATSSSGALRLDGIGAWVNIPIGLGGVSQTSFSSELWFRTTAPTGVVFEVYSDGPVVRTARPTSRTGRSVSTCTLLLSPKYAQARLRSTTACGTAWLARSGQTGGHSSTWTERSPPCNLPSQIRPLAGIRDFDLGTAISVRRVRSRSFRGYLRGSPVECRAGTESARSKPRTADRLPSTRPARVLEARREWRDDDSSRLNGRRRQWGPRRVLVRSFALGHARPVLSTDEVTGDLACRADATFRIPASPSASACSLVCTE
jgi:hypothetical protein